MPLLVCHIGWMNHYEGLQGKNDPISGGGQWVEEHGNGGEVCNFLRCRDGNVYGHFETIKRAQNITIDRSVNINLLGAGRNDESIRGVDVVWTATHPEEGGRRVVGWYSNAEVFRKREQFQRAPANQHKLDRVSSFRVCAKASDATLIPPSARTLKLGHGRGWIGRVNWWYPEPSDKPEVRAFLRRVRALMKAGGDTADAATDLDNSQRGWGRRNQDPQRKAEVEKAAIAFVEEYFSEYDVRSVEGENLGWDLEACSKGKLVFRLEVKGLFSDEFKVGLTPREYQALRSHMAGQMKGYRLCVVTGALSDSPRLVVLRYRGQHWFDECAQLTVSPELKVLEAAIVSLESESR